MRNKKIARSLEVTIGTDSSGWLAGGILKKLKPALILCLLTVSSHMMAQDLYPEHELGVTVPTQHSGRGKKNKLATKRVQLKMADGVYSVFITPVNKIPQYIRKVEIQTTDSLSQQHKIKIRKRSIQKSLIEWQDVTIQALSGKLVGEDNYLPLMAKYKTNTSRFIDGKSGGRTVMSQWQRLAAFSLPAGSSIQKMKVKAGLLKKQEYILSSAVASASKHLPAVDDDDCVPFNRFYERKKLAGYGLENLKYLPYSLPRNKTVRKIYEVYFEEGKSTLSEEALNSITDHLKANNLTIFRATVEGYSSIDGTFAENEKLQKERARLLLRTLQRYNNEPILNDTVMTHDGWEELRKAVAKSPLQWIDSLTKEDLIQRLGCDATLRGELEPYLKSQRKAKLTLALSGAFSTGEIMKRLTTDFDHAANLLRNPLNIGVYQISEKKIMGILAYAEVLAQAGKISYEQIAELADNSTSPERTRVLLFYHTIKTLVEKKTNHEQLDTLFSQYKWNNVFEVANDNIISLIQDTNSHQERRIRLRQAVDVQYYTFKYIEEGLLDVSVLNNIQYPNNKTFYGLQLNHYAFLHEYAKHHSLPENDIIDEVGPPPFEINPDAPIASLDGKYISQPDFLSKLVSQDFINPMVSPATFDSGPKSDYYFFLKTLFVTKDEKIREFVQTSDQMIEFDLLHFIRLQMHSWNPYSNHFYDQDIQLNELHGLVKKLKSINGRICTPVVNQLYLDYHLKALYYLSLYWNPLNSEHVKIADESMGFIANYYKARKAKMDPMLEEQIKQQLNMLYWLPSRKASVLYYK